MGPGGCATGTKKHPPLITQKVESIKECYGLCKTKDTCTYFEYETLRQDSVGIFCHMHFWSDIDRGNGDFGFKCYKMDVDGKYAL